MNLIFDFDGTICDSVGEIVKVANTIFKKYGYLETSVKEFKQKGLKGLIKSRKISILKINKVINDYRNISSDIYTKVKPFNHIDKVLKKLSINHRLGILTTNDKEIVYTFLEKYNLDVFDFVYSEKKLFSKDKRLKQIISHYKLDPTKTFYIGDETRDMEAAKKNSIGTIAVAWGGESSGVLKKSNPDKIVYQPQELEKLWK